jgi:AAA domain-containing protein
MNPPITISNQTAPKPKVKFSNSPAPGEDPIEHKEGPLFSIAFFNNKNDATPKLGKGNASWKWKNRAPQTWPEFVEIFRKPTVRTDKDGPLFSPARFISPRRLNGNVDSLSMLVWDFDHNITLSESLEICEGLGVNFLIYSTFSHQRVTKSHPKEEDCFRVVIPLKAPIPSGDFPYLWEWGNALFHSKADQQRRDLCGMYFLPMVYNTDSPYEFYSKVDGDFLNWKGLKGGDGAHFVRTSASGGTGAVAVVCSSALSFGQEGLKGGDTQSSSSAPVSPKGASQPFKKLPLTLEDITLDSTKDKDFEGWKAELIVHISSHPLARLNRSGNVDAPGLCHGSETGKGVFLNPSLNNTTCSKIPRCPITRIAEAYNYPPPPKSKGETEFKENGERKEVKTKIPFKDLPLEDQQRIVDIVDKMNAKLRDEPKVESPEKEEDPKVKDSNSKAQSSGPKQGTTPTIEFCLAEIKAKPIEWLWDQRIPRASVTMVTGFEQIGKGTVFSDIASAVTRGEGLDGLMLKEPSNVLWLAAEDTYGHDVKPRMYAAEANLDRVYGYDKLFQIDTAQIGLLRGMIERRKPALVVIDPIFSYIKGNPNEGPVARATMDGLKRLAEEFDCSIVTIRHIGKAKGQGDPRASGMGSIEWRNAARSELLFGADPKNKENKTIATIKHNRTRGASSIGYQIGEFPCDLEGLPPNSKVSGVIWTGESSVTAERILATLPQESEDDLVSRQSTVEFLEAILKDGEVASADVKAVAKTEDFTPKQLERARTKLGVRIRYEGQGKDQRTYWRLPDSNNPVSGFPQVSPNDSRFPHSVGEGETSEIIEPKAFNPNNFPGFPTPHDVGKPETERGKPETSVWPDSNNSTPETNPQGIPFMITHSMRGRLHDLGYTDSRIDQMTPQQLSDILDPLSIEARDILLEVEGINDPSILAAKRSLELIGEVSPDQLEILRANLPMWRARNGNGVRV